MAKIQREGVCSMQCTPARRCSSAGLEPIILVPLSKAHEHFTKSAKYLYIPKDLGTKCLDIHTVWKLGNLKCHSPLNYKTKYFP